MDDPHSQEVAANKNNRKAQAIGLVVFLFACLLSTARILMETPSLTQLKAAPSEVASRSDNRFAEIRKALPERGVVGYIGESTPSSLPDYYLAQYALAPLVVEHSTEHEFVIGNFPSSAHPTIANEPPSRLILVRDFGKGVMLFAKRNSE